MEMIRVKMDVAEIRSYINDIIITGEQYLNSYVQLSRLLTKSTSAEANNPLILIQIQNEQIAIKLRMQAFIDDKTKELTRKMIDFNSIVEKQTKIISDWISEISLNNKVIEDFNNKKNPMLQDRELFANAIQKANISIESMPKNQQIMDENTQDNIEYNDELQRGHIFINELSNRFQRVQ